jgi:hypothetical protein
MSEKSDAREEVQELSSDGVRSALNWRIGGSESNAGWEYEQTITGFA